MRHALVFYIMLSLLPLASATDVLIGGNANTQFYMVFQGGTPHDTYPPSITSLQIQPTLPILRQTVLVSANVIENTSGNYVSGLSHVNLSVYSGNTRLDHTNMTLDSGTRYTYRFTNTEHVGVFDLAVCGVDASENVACQSTSFRITGGEDAQAGGSGLTTITGGVTTPTTQGGTGENVTEQVRKSVLESVDANVVRPLVIVLILVFVIGLFLLVTLLAKKDDKEEKRKV